MADRIIVTPPEKPLRSIETLLLECQRHFQDQLDYFKQAKQGPLTKGELDAIAIIVRGLKSIQAVAPQQEQLEDLSKLTPAEIEKQLRAAKK